MHIYIYTLASNLRARVLLGQAFFKQKDSLENKNNSAKQKLNIDLSSVAILLSSSDTSAAAQEAWRYQLLRFYSCLKVVATYRVNMEFWKILNGY